VIGFTRLGRGCRYLSHRAVLMQRRSPWEGRIMQDAMPARWIEQAESRRVLTDTLSERQPAPPRCRDAN